MSIDDKKTAAEFREDSFVNLIKGINTVSDSRRQVYSQAPYAYNAVEFENLYLSNNFASTVVDLPVGEMLRAGYKLQVSGDDGEEIESNVLQACADLDLDKHIETSLRWAKIFGGAVVVIGADDGGDLREPLNLDRVRKISYLQSFDRRLVIPSEYYSDPHSEKFSLPSVYAFVKYGAQVPTVNEHIHESRLLIFEGVPVTQNQRIKNLGWGDSVFIRGYDALVDLDQVYDAVSALVIDFPSVTYKMKGLAAMLASQPDNTQPMRRVQNLFAAKSMTRMMPLDADGESIERGNVPTTGLPELLDRLVLRVASTYRIPVTLLMGQSPAGMNATGASDTQFFYDNIARAQKTELEPQLKKFLRVLFAAQQGPTRGQVPEQWSIQFNPLWQMSDTEKADVRLKMAQADAVYLQNGVLSPEEIGKARFAAEGYSIDTTIAPDDFNTPDIATSKTLMTELTAPQGTPTVQGSESIEAIVDRGIIPNNPVSNTVLNGAQLAALTALAQQVERGDLSVESGLLAGEEGFNWEPSRIERYRVVWENARAKNKATISGASADGQQATTAQQATSSDNAASDRDGTKL